MTEGLIIDMFAGGGGASVGIELALGRSPDIAVNHDPQAILMHKTNHPNTLHLTEDVFAVDLLRYTKGKHVSLMWASPDCTQFSKAKGGRPRESGIRMLPWAVYKHAKAVRPDVIVMENVEEIQKWGPLDKNGRPIKGQAGEEYQRFIAAIKSMGYVFDCRELVAADYGAPTTRKRWYAIFRCDGQPIVWPEQTHSKDGAVPGTEPWEPIWKYLDLLDFGKSIFGRKKPLAEKTMRRIAAGLDKFVFKNPEPFIVTVNHGGEKFRGQSIHEPLSTITSKHGYGVITPVLAPYMMRNNHGAPGGNAKSPLLTITTGGHHGLITPVLSPFIDKAYAGNYKGCGSKSDEPLSTVTTVDHNRLVTPILIQYHSETTKDPRGQYVTEPIKTIDTSNRYAMVSAFLTKFYKSGTGQSVMEPLHTITTSPGHFGQVSILAVDWEQLKQSGIDEETAQKCTWVSQFIMEYYGCGTGQTLDEPLHTVVTKDRFALITILGSEYCIVDIFLRMLSPEELKLAQGFPKDYIIDRDYRWKPYPKSAQVARIGNSVVPIVAKAIVEANCSEIKVGERQPRLSVTVESNGQIAFA